MYGYVRALQNKISNRDEEVYNGYYCGLCKALGERYSQGARFLLSYDMTFLSIIMSSVAGKNESISHEKCILHHIKTKPVIKSLYNAYAADMGVILAYEKMLDDRADGGFKGSSLEKLYRGLYRKAADNRPKAAEMVHSDLKKLYDAEGRRENSIDTMAEFFAKVMRDIFGGCDELNSAVTESTVRALEEAGAELGRWIYVIDALDDFDDDIKSGSYNPLVLKYGSDRKRAAEDMRPVLFRYLEMLAAALDIAEIKDNFDLIDNIVYLGLRARTEEVLKGKDPNG